MYYVNRARDHAGNVACRQVIGPHEANLVNPSRIRDRWKLATLRIEFRPSTRPFRTSWQVRHPGPDPGSWACTLQAWHRGPRPLHREGEKGKVHALGQDDRGAPQGMDKRARGF